MKIIKTGISRPPTMLVYSEHKVGKSTFAAGCPKPLFIQTESGLEGIETDAFPLCASFQEFEKCLDEVERLPIGQYKTLVIDSIDWLERLIHRKVCSSHGVTDIGQIGYGKGHTAAETIWGEVIDRLHIINKDKKLMIVLLAHAIVQKFEDPERDSYDRILPDLHKKSVNAICEFVDILGYAALKIVTASSGKDGPKKAKATGERILFLQSAGGFQAGNRYGLPSSLPLSWAAIAQELSKKRKAGNLEEVKKARVDDSQVLGASAEPAKVQEQKAQEPVNV